MPVDTNDPSLNAPAELERLLQQALAENATDIHIDGFRGGGFQIRFRVDGHLQLKRNLSNEQGPKLLKQIRVHSQLGIDKVLRPLEGRASWTESDSRYGIRVSIVPTLSSTSAHLRILTPPQDIIQAEDLGMGQEDLKTIKRILTRNEGLIVFAGATGAGKTTTLYSLVSLLDLAHSVAVSIEDPVEYDLPQVRQIQVDERHGLDMHEGLLTILRMDPDIIMVGELRDSDSTMTAAQAAASGHFVFTTLHSASPHMALATLRFLGVPDHLLGNTLRLIVMQGLVRRLCARCAEPQPPTESESALFRDEGIEPPGQILHPRGCKECGNYGYRGRIGLFQIVPVDDEMGILITRGADPREIGKLIADRSIPTLFKDGLLKVAKHDTSLSEVLPFYRGEKDLLDLSESTRDS